MDKLARKPDDNKPRLVKKDQGVPYNLNKAVLVWKKSKQRRWSGHDCTSRVVVGRVDCQTCQVLGHSMNSNCGIGRSVDCERDGRRRHKLVQHWLSEQSHQRSFRPEGARRSSRYTFFQRPLRIRPNHARHKPSSLQVHSSGRVANATIKLEMLLLVLFRPRRHAVLPWPDRKLCTAEVSNGLFAPQWDRGREFPYFKTVSWRRPIDRTLFP